MASNSVPGKTEPRNMAGGDPLSVDARFRTPLKSIPDAPFAGPLKVEGDDAHLTGMTRSLRRRIFGLNFPVSREITAAKAA